MEQAVPISSAVGEAFSVRGAVTIVTGAAGWIGGGIVRAFAENGARVVLSDLPGEKLTERVRELEAAGFSVLGQAADLTKAEELAALVAATVEKFGRVDALIHCGGIPLSVEIEKEEPERFDALFHTNTRSSWLLARELIAPMRKQGGGSIVNICSVNAHAAKFPCALYAGSKAALLAMTRELAVELGEHRIRVNSVSPGVVLKPWRFEDWAHQVLHDSFAAAFVEQFKGEQASEKYFPQPLLVQGAPLDVALACIYLCSPAARFISGADILVDGGFLWNFLPPHSSGRKSRTRAYLRGLPAEAWRDKPPAWIYREN